MKYEILSNISKDINGTKVYRIRATKDFSNVKNGDLGGWVQYPHNLSQQGDCWIYNEACVYGEAKVYGSAKVYDSAEVYGSAKVYDNAEVFGNAVVVNEVQICGNALVFSQIPNFCKTLERKEL